jgi:multidrug efflux system membrane fusion protein
VILALDANPTQARSWRRVSPLLVAFALLACACGSSGDDPGVRRDGPPAPVVVASAVRKSVQVEVRAVGTVEALHTVSVLPQVGGQIRTVHFQEGDLVAQDALLFTIDTRPLQATLGEARARLAKGEALAKQARDAEKRAEGLRAQGLISEQEYEAARAAADSTAATIAADRAAVAGASIDVGFANIRAPIDGRTGSLLVHAGNVVKPADKALVVIRKTKPIHVRFAIPEQYLPRLRAGMAQAPLAVAARPRGHEGEPARGLLTFLENTVDTTTGTIALKAEFTNDDELLWPGQFVEVRLELGTEPDAVVVPEAAIQPGQDGDHVFVVNGGGKAELRAVVVARVTAGEAVLRSGLEAGERVVIDGQVRLAPGAAVSIGEAPRAPGPGPVPTASAGATTP